MLLFNNAFHVLYEARHIIVTIPSFAVVTNKLCKQLFTRQLHRFWKAHLSLQWESFMVNIADTDWIHGDKACLSFIASARCCVYPLRVNNAIVLPLYRWGKWVKGRPNKNNNRLRCLASEPGSWCLSRACKAICTFLSKHTRTHTHARMHVHPPTCKHTHIPAAWRHSLSSNRACGSEELWGAWHFICCCNSPDPIKEKILS